MPKVFSSLSAFPRFVALSINLLRNTLCFYLCVSLFHRVPVLAVFSKEQIDFSASIFIRRIFKCTPKVIIQLFRLKWIAINQFYVAN